MRSNLTDVYEKVKHSVSDTVQSLVKNIENLLEKDTTTIFELSEIIKNHPDTIIKQQTLLNITYVFYDVTIGETVFHMEAKGQQGQYILALSAVKDGRTHLNYHSYEEKLTLHTPFKTPNFI